MTEISWTPRPTRLLLCGPVALQASKWVVDDDDGLKKANRNVIKGWRSLPYM